MCLPIPPFRRMSVFGMVAQPFPWAFVYKGVAREVPRIVPLYYQVISTIYPNPKRRSVSLTPYPSLSKASIAKNTSSFGKRFITTSALVSPSLVRVHIDS